MKLDGWISMLNIIASSIKTGEGPNTTRYRQRKKSFCTQFLQFATMFSLGLLTIVIQLNSPQIRICWHSCSEGNNLAQIYIRQYGLKSRQDDLLPFHSQSLLSICLEDYWAAYDRSSRPTTSFPTTRMMNSSGPLEARRKPMDFPKRGSNQHGSAVTEVSMYP